MYTNLETAVVVMGLAMAELLVFMSPLTPHFRLANFLAYPVLVRTAGGLTALPFTIWFYLAVEGVALVTEEVKVPDAPSRRTTAMD